MPRRTRYAVIILSVLGAIGGGFALDRLLGAALTGFEIFIVTALWTIVLYRWATAVLKTRDLRHRLDVEGRRLDRYDAVENLIWQAFCIVHTPKDDSVPDARKLLVWRKRFLQVNGGVEGLMRHMDTRTAVSVPKPGKGDGLSLDQARKLQALLQVPSAPSV